MAHLNQIGIFGAVGALAVGGVMLAGGVGAPSQADAAGAAGEFGVDGMHSSVVFNVSYMGTTNFWGRFNDVSGTFNLDAGNPSGSAIDIEIATSSIDTGNDGRDKHLRGGDFFSAREFPAITFKADSFKGGPNGSIIAEGDLTLRGVTERITATIDIHDTRTDPRMNKPRSGFSTSFEIERSKFGVSYGLDGGVLGDTVEIHVGVTGVQG